MEFRTSHYHVVSDKIVPELRPLMAVFMSYFLQNNHDKNRSSRVKSVHGMFWRLANFLGYIDEHVKFHHFQPCLPGFPIVLIRDYIRKENGSNLTATEQFKLFSNILSTKGCNADVYLYQQGHKEAIEKTIEHENPTTIIPIVRLLDGRFAATSIYNPFTFDLKSSLLRTETQKQRKEKRIAKYKNQLSKFLTNQ
uniref:Uncharacterized protein n=1 Tax=Panagrolaimus sp. ES5 TaxID=591445 RepID=A0AC34G356_9BILA